MALCNIYHFDLYRLADPEEFEYLGTEQYFDAQNLCLVEWAEQGAGWAPGADVLVELRERGTGREAVCTAFTARGVDILDGLNS
jgi:tRNA threonylcarbamoyladenosine biosynthesis protein TsaE